MYKSNIYAVYLVFYQFISLFNHGIYCTEQISSGTSLQNKLINVDAYSLAQQYVQLHHNVKVSN